MALTLSNSLGRSEQVFNPLDPPAVNLYTCGPTVYNHAHIGNLRAYIFADLLYRTLKFAGFNPDWVMNITDVDDKTIKRSIQKKMSLHNLTEKFTNIFFSDLKKSLILIVLIIGVEVGLYFMKLVK